jgi:hypothetical protein
MEQRPIHVTATGTVTPRSTNGVNTVALVNTGKDPMEIRRIKFTMIPEADQYTGSGIACKLDLGQIPLTNGYVPIHCFGKREAGGEDFLTSSTTRAHQFVWNLSRPLFIPPGGVLTPSFEHRSQNTSNVPMRVSYAGNLCARGYKPKKLALPYVCAYTSKVFSTLLIDTDSSSETDLMNPFAETLKIERFAGHVNVWTPSSTSNSETGSAGFFASDDLTLRMTDSLGRRIVRDKAIFDQVFSAVTRSWETKDAELEGGVYVSVDLFKAAATAFVSALYMQAMVSLVGWREIGGAR